MKTAAEIRAEFRADLQAVLDKHGAELEAADHYQGYSECGEDVRMVAHIAAFYDQGELVSEGTEVDLGSHIWPNESETKGGGE